MRKKKTLQAEKVPEPHQFSNGPSLNSVFWFANFFLKGIRFPPIKIYTTWGLIVNFVVELHAVLVAKTVFFRLTCIIYRLMAFF